MEIAESTATYVVGLIGLAVVLRYSDKVNELIKAGFMGYNTFASALLNPMGGFVTPRVNM